jgi:hypothetical protein
MALAKQVGRPERERRRTRERERERESIGSGRESIGVIVFKE